MKEDKINGKKWKVSKNKKELEIHNIMQGQGLYDNTSLVFACLGGSVGTGVIKCELQLGLPGCASGRRSIGDIARGLPWPGLFKVGELRVRLDLLLQFLETFGLWTLITVC